MSMEYHEIERMAEQSGHIIMPPLCPKCGYNLTGATSNRCTECGYIISRSDMKYFSAEARANVYILKDVVTWLHAGRVCAIIALGCAAIGWMLKYLGHCLWIVLYGIALLTAVSSLIMAINLLRYYRVPPGLREQSGAKPNIDIAMQTVVLASLAFVIMLFT